MHVCCITTMGVVLLDRRVWRCAGSLVDFTLKCVAAVLQAILENDPLLAPHADHLQYRWQQYERIKGAIVQAEGSLSEFARVRLLACRL
jgi:hypothetical protein